MSSFYNHPIHTQPPFLRPTFDRKMDNEMRLKRLAALEKSSNSQVKQEKDFKTTTSTFSSTSKPTLIAQPHSVSQPTTSIPSPAPSLDPFYSQSNQDWQDKAISFILKVSLSNQNSTLISDSDSLNSDNFDSILFECLSKNNPSITPSLFDFLVVCWKRCQTISLKLNSFSGPLVDDRRIFLNCYTDLIVSYSGLVIGEMVNVFPQSSLAVSQASFWIANILLAEDQGSIEDKVFSFNLASSKIP